jgi:hypothetical protein
MGKKDNTVAQVKTLQQFFNDTMNTKLPVTGYFGLLTDRAVRAFQKSHPVEVLAPWNLMDPTGFVYKTTQRWINLTHCSSLNIPLPTDLTPYSGQ